MGETRRQQEEMFEGKGLFEMCYGATLTGTSAGAPLS